MDSWNGSSGKNVIMKTKVIYKNIAEFGNKDIVYLTTRCLFPIEQSLEVKIDYRRLNDELELYKCFFNKGKGSIVSSLAPLILANTDDLKANQNSYELYNAIRRNLSLDNKIGITLLTYYIRSKVDSNIEFSSVTMFEGSKEEQVALQRNKIDVILNKYSIEEKIVDLLEETQKEYNIELLKNIDFDNREIHDEYLDKMSIYFQKVCLFQINKNPYSGKLNLNKIFSSGVNQKNRDPLIGDFWVISKREIDNMSVVKINAKMGQIELFSKLKFEAEKTTDDEFGLKKIKIGWKSIFDEEVKKMYFLNLLKSLSQEYSDNTIYPDKENVFEIFRRIDYSDVKVVIIGQDPYHGPNQANGMCFSVNHGIKNPPSLKNIFQELNSEYGILRTDGDLTDWVDQGVLLLNSILTVRQSLPGSHKKIGWEEFTDMVIYKLNQRKEPLVFVLWGNYAIEKAKLVDREKHYVLTSNHPSPFSCHKGFFGNNHFRLTNEYLKKNGKQEIVWIKPNT